MKKDSGENFLYISNYPLDSNASAAIRNRAMIEGLIKQGYKAFTLTRESTNKKNIKGIEQYYFKNNSLMYSIAHSVKEEKNNLLWKLRELIAKMSASLSIYDNQRILLKNLDEVALSVSSFDFVISSSDSKVSHVVAERLIENGRIKTGCWIQYWGDPFYNDINRTTILPKALIIKEEERLLSKANYIIYTSPFTVEEQKKIFGRESSKMFFIPTPYIQTRIYKPTSNKNIIIGYYGSYYKRDRDILPLYEVAQKLESYKFQFVGSSDLSLDEKHNIEVIERVPYKKIIEYEAKCDILVCLANRAGSSQIPGKLYHYAATNKPILFIYEQGEERIAEYFKQFNRYYMCENNEQKIMMEIEKIVNNKTDDLRPITEFDCKIVANDILDIISV